MKRRDIGALQAEAEAIMRSERRTLSGVDLFERLPQCLKDKTTRRRIFRDLAKTTLRRLPDGSWTIHPQSLWRVPPRGPVVSARGERIKLLKDSANRAFAMVEQQGPSEMRSLHKAVSPDIDFVSFKKALVNRICETSRWGRIGEIVYLRPPINAPE